MPPTCRDLIRPQLQTRRDLVHHQSECYGEPYEESIRRLVLAFKNAGHSDHPIISELRNQHHYPSKATENRWNSLVQNIGHYRACRRTGNKWGKVFRGNDLVLLAMYRLVYPKAQQSELNAFLYRCNFGNLGWRFYSPSQITTAEHQIGLSRKAGSSTAYQALLPINILKRHNYWNMSYPLGIADISRADMIDLDECGIFVETANRKHGKAYVGVRVKEPGPYSKSEKWNLLLAICGENGQIGAPSRRWRKLWLDGGTTNDKMIAFIREILDDIGPALPGHRRMCFTMDNLNSHHNIQVAQMIYASGHRLAFRAPYYPVDGAIEYVFNTLQCMLRVRLHTITDGNSLTNEIGRVIQSMIDFSSYFRHCGFIRP